MLNIIIADNSYIENCFDVRKQVFCIEQGVDEKIERDYLDKTATHLLATLDNKPVGCCRMLFEDYSVHVGRLAVLKEYRNKGIAKAICKFAFSLAKESDCKLIWLNAQLHSVDFYKKLGFTPVGKVFVEANMEHIKMEKQL